MCVWTTACVPQLVGARGIPHANTPLKRLETTSELEQLDNRGEGAVCWLRIMEWLQSSLPEQRPRAASHSPPFQSTELARAEDDEEGSSRLVGKLVGQLLAWLGSDGSGRGSERTMWDWREQALTKCKCSNIQAAQPGFKHRSTCLSSVLTSYLPQRWRALY